MHSFSEYVRRALQAGARGYLLKESLGREVILAVRHVVAGRRYLSQRIADDLIGTIGDPSGVAPGESPLDMLSPREREVLQMLVQGCSGKKIATVLSISSKTVDTYRSRLMQKLKADNLPALVMLAIKHGVIPPEK
jgi:DNA-binding NarL/FixJ family response regulator